MNYLEYVINSTNKILNGRGPTNDYFYKTGGPNKNG